MATGVLCPCYAPSIEVPPDSEYLLGMRLWRGNGEPSGMPSTFKLTNRSQVPILLYSGYKVADGSKSSCGCRECCRYFALAHRTLVYGCYLEVLFTCVFLYTIEGFCAVFRDPVVCHGNGYSSHRLGRGGRRYWKGARMFLMFEDDSSRKLFVSYGRVSIRVTECCSRGHE